MRRVTRTSHALPNDGCERKPTDERQEEEVMVFRRMLGLGLLSPAFSPETTCEGSYDRAAGACDDIGE